jgi:hypothetical protein
VIPRCTFGLISVQNTVSKWFEISVSLHIGVKNTSTKCLCTWIKRKRSTQMGCNHFPQCCNLSSNGRIHITPAWVNLKQSGLNALESELTPSPIQRSHLENTGVNDATLLTYSLPNLGAMVKSAGRTSHQQYVNLVSGFCQFPQFLRFRKPGTPKKGIYTIISKGSSQGLTYLGLTCETLQAGFLKNGHGFPSCHVSGFFFRFFLVFSGFLG